ncbi:hypothetical protein BO78DRAFT_191236 [Aspergillus sclerotiicarbonarius CBS 121057]|uniref:Uncharacterized protein n=1 Tax=Aspergillus sclerotiicarbonarius (strain CBS 121057 / IBT 28362) TaxID=1448318 RepID=A0A319E1C8_ASPSB|nr:hypothetical protein BO78DRAFT_191236 [Aspergillus sclerotiicarbonarius CBS 121057]
MPSFLVSGILESCAGFPVCTNIHIGERFKMNLLNMLFLLLARTIFRLITIRLLATSTLLSTFTPRPPTAAHRIIHIDICLLRHVSAPRPSQCGGDPVSSSWPNGTSRMAGATRPPLVGRLWLLISLHDYIFQRR